MNQGDFDKQFDEMVDFYRKRKIRILNVIYVTVIAAAFVSIFLDKVEYLISLAAVVVVVFVYGFLIYEMRKYRTTKQVLRAAAPLTMLVLATVFLATIAVAIL